MKTVFVFALLCLAIPAQAAPWVMSWSQLIPGDGIEPNAVILGNSESRPIVVGTTYGRVADPTGDAPDLFRAALDPSGQINKLTQAGEAGGQYLRGAARSIWGYETLVQMDYEKQTWEILNRSASGKTRWRLPMSNGQYPLTGVVRDFWGRHWIATRPNNGSKPYAVSMISSSGELLWTHDATGPEKMGSPRILRRNRQGDLILGVSIFTGQPGNFGSTRIACYDRELKAKWQTELSPSYGIPRDIAFDSPATSM